MKTLTEIAIECGADVVLWDRQDVVEGNIVFDNEHELQAFVDVVNAQNSEPVGEIISDTFYRFSKFADIFNIKDIPIGTKLYTSPQPNQLADDEWFKKPYTKVLQDSIKNDYVPKADQSAYIKRLEDALAASLALNINWSSEAETEMLSYFSEYKDVIKQTKEALASKESK